MYRGPNNSHWISISWRQRTQRRWTTYQIRSRLLFSRQRTINNIQKDVRIEYARLPYNNNIVHLGAGKIKDSPLSWRILKARSGKWATSMRASVHSYAPRTLISVPSQPSPCTNLSHPKVRLLSARDPKESQAVLLSAQLRVSSASAVDAHVPSN